MRGGTGLSGINVIRLSIGLVFILSITAAVSPEAAVPQKINYQGRGTDSATGEVPEEKLDGAVLFWNGDESRFEVYLPSAGEFRDLMANLLARIPTP